MLRYVPDRVLLIRIVAALAPLAVVAFIWIANRPPLGIPNGTIVQITHSRSFEGQPSLSPDGTVVAFRCDYHGNSDVCVSDVSGGNLRNLTLGSREDESEPAFSPDGQTIAFRGGSRGIFTIPAAGGTPVQLTTTGESPAWTPDGRSVVYSVATIAGAVFRQGVTEGFTIDLASRATRRIPIILDFHEPAVSPRGWRIAYVGRQAPPPTRRAIANARTDVWTVALDGRPAVRVTSDNATETSPLWSADGRFLYYVSDRNGSSAIWRVAIDERTGQLAGRPEVVPTPYSQPTQITRSADGRQLAWADRQPLERILRVEFDADARATRGAPVEIAAGGSGFDGPDVPSDPGPPRPPASVNPAMPLAALAYPGHWSPQRTLYAGTAAGAVWIYSSATREHYQLRPGSSPVWLNDGRRLIFSAEGRLFIAEAVLKISRELIALGDQSLGSPRLSPDNRQLYFTSEGVDANLWMLTADR
jgi:dipeptidyl aminopeptidase/acylaminoacyl peptidase